MSWCTAFLRHSVIIKNIMIFFIISIAIIIIIVSFVSTYKDDQLLQTLQC